MAAFDFSPAQAAASMAEEQQASVPIQSLLMQIDADAVCLVRTQFQQILHLTSLQRTKSVPTLNRCPQNQKMRGVDSSIWRPT